MIGGKIFFIIYNIPPSNPTSPLKPTGQNLLHIFYLMKCPLPSTYPARIIPVILREFALFFSFYNLSTILTYETIFKIKSLRGGVILHALLLTGGGSLYVISIFLIHDIRIYEPQSGMSLTAFAGM